MWLVLVIVQFSLSTQNPLNTQEHKLSDSLNKVGYCMRL